MTEYENLEAQHKLLKDENKRREHRLLFEAIDNLTTERDLLRSEVERVRRETIEEIMTDWADHMKRMVKAIK